MKNTSNFYTINFLLFIFLSSNFAHANLCIANKLRELVLKGEYQKEVSRTTEIEASLFKEGVSYKSLQKHLEETLDLLKVSDPEMHQKVLKTINKKNKSGARALLIDTSSFNQKMHNFLNGPYKKIVGNRGLSVPFMDIKMLDENTLSIHHRGDSFPLVVKWGDSPKARIVMSTLPDGGLQKTLEIPQNLTSIKELRALKKKVYGLISGSRINKYIPSERSVEGKLAAIIHDGKLVHPRPSQVEFLSLREKIDQNPELNKRIPSLLFVAPTAAGKTRIIGDNLIHKIKQTNESITQGLRPRKLSIVMANSPELVSQLGQDIGGQLIRELPSSNFRIIQWGGKLTENMGMAELETFVNNSTVPVVLITSSQTIAARLKGEGGIPRLMKLANSLTIDEAHNSTSPTFKQVYGAALEISKETRNNGSKNTLDILGVTASPLNRVERSAEVFERSYFAGSDSPGKYAQRVLKDSGKELSSTSSDLLEWVKIPRQLRNAVDRGEIVAPDQPVFFNPRDYGFNFDSLFTRSSSSGTQSYVDVTKLEMIWPKIAPMIEPNGNGIIHAFPRDSKNISETLSRLTGKNFVNINVDANQRALILDAFKNKKPYKGENIYSIVGQIREGFDVPHAGWYFSFKRYVKFPENIQGPGRVFRLDLDKANPVVLFFGDFIDSVAYRDIRGFVLNQFGKLPRNMEEGRGFSGSRLFSKSHPESVLGASTLELNTGIEAIFRQNPEITKSFNKGGEGRAATLTQFNQIIEDTMRGRGNIEIRNALRAFAVEANSFTFFKGNLLDTWNYADKLLKHQKNPELSRKNLTELDLKILSDQSEMKNVAEFRSMKNWLGGDVREVLQSTDLAPRGVYELASILDSFVARYGDAALGKIENWSLRPQLEESLALSPDTIYNRLSYRSKTILDPSFNAAKESSLEQGLNQHFKETGKLPENYFEKLNAGEDIILADKSSHYLAMRLEAFMQSGKLSVKDLEPSFLKELDKSPFFQKQISKSIVALEGEISTLKQELSFEARSKVKIKISDLTKTEGFGVIKTLNDMANSNLPMAQQYRIQLEKLLQSGFEE